MGAPSRPGLSVLRVLTSPNTGIQLQISLTDTIKPTWQQLWRSNHSYRSTVAGSTRLARTIGLVAAMRDVSSNTPIVTN